APPPAPADLRPHLLRAPFAALRVQVHAHAPELRSLQPDHAPHSPERRPPDRHHLARLHSLRPARHHPEPTAPPPLQSLDEMEQPSPTLLLSLLRSDAR